MVEYNSVLDVQFQDGVITEPVTLTEAKNFCKIDISTDDDLINVLITAARQMCEAYTGVGFVEHDVVAVLNNSNGDIYIPYGPMIEIISVEDDAGRVLVLDLDYTIGGNEFKRLRTPQGNNITIDYITGYTTLPEALKTALLNQVYYLYDNRSVGVDDISPIAKIILNLYKRV
ncbi:Phage conserved hypothetical protein [uncultured Caudovirales phage]|uniref:Gp6 domain containing protein n=1 Tax=uncultured Caudovirales phage TaxID=2100421 RepID=A0A6J5MP51_9CAUD|nr:Phage conserved hypothetical protein [uncultured Caudovirales phage]